MTVTPLGNGVYRVEEENGRAHIVYVAGPRGDRWAFCRGALFRETPAKARSEASRRPGQGSDAVQQLSAPMPATVTRLLVQPGASVRKGESILVLEAMKMELPLRAPADAIVAAVHCQEGDLVQPGTILIELR
jgi:biotin carboxyl carrier protein